MIKCWIEAMRLRTLPVSAAGVLMGASLGVYFDCFRLLPVVLCMVFALLAQVASNFANEYYDYRDGLDSKGRVGPRRGVTEGDISPLAMKRATFATLALACCVGLSLIHWGGWWLIAVGVVIALGALSYSAGPYPLSRHALGGVAVVLFFGLVPVVFTLYLQAGVWSGGYLPTALAVGLAAGLLGNNILNVNNYRDVEDDRAVGKITTAVKFGREYVSLEYLLGGLAAVALTMPLWVRMEPWAELLPVVWLIGHVALWRFISTHDGVVLNKALGITAMNFLLFAILFLVAVAASGPVSPIY